MKHKPRVVFDTNIFISAIIFGGNSRRCLELVREEKITLLTSKAILLELTRKLRDKFRWRQEDIRDVIQGIGVFAPVVESNEKINHIKADEPDNRILEAAAAGKADFIISGDKHHLLPLGTYRNTRIISPTTFLLKYIEPHRQM